MKNLIKLLTLTLVFTSKSLSLFSMDHDSVDANSLLFQNSSLNQTSAPSSTSNLRALGYEAKIDHENKTQCEVKKQEESSIDKINKFRSECLEKHMPKVLSNLVQEYDPIVDEWECENTIGNNVNTLCVLSGNRLASGTIDGTIIITDLLTNNCIMTISLGYTRNVNALCELPGNKLASTSDKNIEICNLKKGLGRVKSLKGHKGLVSSLCSLPNNKLASGSYDHTIKIWDIITGNCIQTLEACTEQSRSACTEQGRSGHTDLVLALCPLSGNKLASASKDHTIKIWDTETGNCLQTLEGHTNCVIALCLLPGNKLVSATWDTIKIWDSITGNCIQTLKGHPIPIVVLCPLPDNRLASGSYDATIKIWDLNNYQCINTLKKCHEDSITALCLLPNKKLVSGSKETIKIWSNSVYRLIYEQQIDHQVEEDSISKNNSCSIL